MTKPKIPDEMQQVNVERLFEALLALARYATGRCDDDPRISVAAALILLDRLGLAAPNVRSTEEDDVCYEHGSEWVLTVEGNKRLAGLLKELRQWDPFWLAKQVRKQRS